MKKERKRHIISNIFYSTIFLLIAAELCWIGYLGATFEQPPLYEVVYTINDIKIDNDGEYHLTSVSDKGEAFNLNDLANSWDVHVVHLEEATVPILIQQYHYEGLPVGTPLIILPKDYVIEIF
jgi:hypothetical protein